MVPLRAPAEPLPLVRSYAAAPAVAADPVAALGSPSPAACYVPPVHNLARQHLAVVEVLVAIATLATTQFSPAVAYSTVAAVRAGRRTLRRPGGPGNVINITVVRSSVPGQRMTGGQGRQSREDSGTGTLDEFAPVHTPGKAFAQDFYLLFQHVCLSL